MSIRRIFLGAILLFLCSLSLAKTVKPLVGQTINFSTDDGIALAGTVYLRGNAWVILSHQYDGDQQEWQPLIPYLLAKGYTVLTYNFRGYPPSAGSLNIPQIGHDLDAAIAYARSRGATQLGLVGASMGGIITVPGAVVAQPAAIVLLSAPRAFGSIAASDENLQKLASAKLFINSRYDNYWSDTLHMQEVAAEPKQIQIYPGGAHGTALFDSKAVLARISDFIASKVPLK